MRTIKFRAWDGIEMLYPSAMNPAITIAPECDDNSLIYSLEWDADGDMEEAKVSVINGAAMQFTGIVDAKGVDVYDGDLLRVPAKSDFEKKTYNCFEVFYHDNECIGGFNVGFCMNRMHSHGSSAGGQCYKFTPESIAKNGFVVIGNIYQNPELLK